MQKKFKEQIGMSPKAYACATRFRSLISELYNNPDLSWMDLVVHYEYTDQSHLIKDFHRYTGTSPKEYFRYTLKLDQVMQETLWICSFFYNERKEKGGNFGKKDLETIIWK